MQPQVPPWPDDEDPAVWHVTPLGRAVLQQILVGLGESIGRAITSNELGEAMRRLRHETGLVDPPLTDPRILRLLLDLLRDGPEEER